jgi:hypothetical protein
MIWYLSAAVVPRSLAGLFRKIDQDRAGFPKRDRLSVRAIGVDDRGDLVVGVQRQELRAFHVGIGQGYAMRLVGQAQLLQRDRGLDAVLRGEGV